MQQKDGQNKCTSILTVMSVPPSIDVGQHNIVRLQALRGISDGDDRGFKQQEAGREEHVQHTSQARSRTLGFARCSHGCSRHRRGTPPHPFSWNPRGMVFVRKESSRRPSSRWRDPPRGENGSCLPPIFEAQSSSVAHVMHGRAPKVKVLGTTHAWNVFLFSG